MVLLGMPKYDAESASKSTAMIEYIAILALGVALIWTWHRKRVWKRRMNDREKDRYHASRLRWENLRIAEGYEILRRERLTGKPSAPDDWPDEIEERK